MKTGVAMWHYHHRSVAENVRYFTDNGLRVLGFNQLLLMEAFEAGEADEVARILKDTETSLTMHGALSYSHEAERVEDFKKRMMLIGEWQEKYRLIQINSFDVPQSIRDDVRPYIDYAMNTVKHCYTAVEDFGLTDAERVQIDDLKTDKRFGYLVDIGHLYIRMRGKTVKPATLFNNSPTECPVCETPQREDFLRAFASKEFPVLEIHLHNNDGADDLHYFLDEGTLDISVIADVLKTIDYQGIVTIESAPGFRFECDPAESDRRICASVDYWNTLTSQ